ncbi:hypothetical protein CYMTET_39457 [Cymbomonas tetramitiformis]|uniref:Uncharacterized protein n=1 Tax=Cymbomonas tetramitiformis TaxID=36881 RepID=A0AAE0CBQ1_9CHLO|nr:hypothetical protein CYMTET_39457 [Cymbomonas tetramitiformis]
MDVRVGRTLDSLAPVLVQAPLPRCADGTTLLYQLGYPQQAARAAGGATDNGAYGGTVGDGLPRHNFYEDHPTVDYLARVVVVTLHGGSNGKPIMVGPMEVLGTSLVETVWHRREATSGVHIRRRSLDGDPREVAEILSACSVKGTSVELATANELGGGVAGGEAAEGRACGGGLPAAGDLEAGSEDGGRGDPELDAVGEAALSSEVVLPDGSGYGEMPPAVVEAEAMATADAPAPPTRPPPAVPDSAHVEQAEGREESVCPSQEESSSVEQGAAEETGGKAGTPQGEREVVKEYARLALRQVEGGGMGFRAPSLLTALELELYRLQHTISAKERDAVLRARGVDPAFLDPNAYVATWKSEQLEQQAGMMRGNSSDRLDAGTGPSTGSPYVVGSSPAPKSSGLAATLIEAVAEGVGFQMESKPAAVRMVDRTGSGSSGQSWQPHPMVRTKEEVVLDHLRRMRQQQQEQAAASAAAMALNHLQELCRLPPGSAHKDAEPKEGTAEAEAECGAGDEARPGHDARVPAQRASLEVGHGASSAPGAAPLHERAPSIALFPHAGLLMSTPTCPQGPPAEALLVEGAGHPLGDWRAPAEVRSVEFTVVLPVASMVCGVALQAGALGLSSDEVPLVQVSAGTTLHNMKLVLTRAFGRHQNRERRPSGAESTDTSRSEECAASCDLDLGEPSEHMSECGSESGGDTPAGRSASGGGGSASRWSGGAGSGSSGGVAPYETLSLEFTAPVDASLVMVRLELPSTSPRQMGTHPGVLRVREEEEDTEGGWVSVSPPASDSQILGTSPVDAALCLGMQGAFRGAGSAAGDAAGTSNGGAVPPTAVGGGRLRLRSLRVYGHVKPLLPWQPVTERASERLLHARAREEGHGVSSVRGRITPTWEEVRCGGRVVEMGLPASIRSVSGFRVVAPLQPRPAEGETAPLCIRVGVQSEPWRAIEVQGATAACEATPPTKSPVPAGAVGETASVGGTTFVGEFMIPSSAEGTLLHFDFLHPVSGSIFVFELVGVSTLGRVDVGENDTSSLKDKIRLYQFVSAMK